MGMRQRNMSMLSGFFSIATWTWIRFTDKMRLHISRFVYIFVMYRYFLDNKKTLSWNYNNNKNILRWDLIQHTSEWPGYSNTLRPSAIAIHLLISIVSSIRNIKNPGAKSTHTQRLERAPNNGNCDMPRNSGNSTEISDNPDDFTAAQKQSIPLGNI